MELNEIISSLTVAGETDRVIKTIIRMLLNADIESVWAYLLTLGTADGRADSSSLLA